MGSRTSRRAIDTARHFFSRQAAGAVPRWALAHGHSPVPLGRRSSTGSASSNTLRLTDFRGLEATRSRARSLRTVSAGGCAVNASTTSFQMRPRRASGAAAGDPWAAGACRVATASLHGPRGAGWDSALPQERVAPGGRGQERRRAGAVWRRTASGAPRATSKTLLARVRCDAASRSRSTWATFRRPHSHARVTPSPRQSVPGSRCTGRCRGRKTVASAGGTRMRRPRGPSSCARRCAGPGDLC
jgi:hypothetical protein